MQILGELVHLDFGLFGLILRAYCNAWFPFLWRLWCLALPKQKIGMIIGLQK